MKEWYKEDLAYIHDVGHSLLLQLLELEFQTLSFELNHCSSSISRFALL